MRYLGDGVYPASLFLPSSQMTRSPDFTQTPPCTREHPVSAEYRQRSRMSRDHTHKRHAQGFKGQLACGQSPHTLCAVSVILYPDYQTVQLRDFAASVQGSESMVPVKSLSTVLNTQSGTHRLRSSAHTASRGRRQLRRLVLAGTSISD